MAAEQVRLSGAQATRRGRPRAAAAAAPAGPRSEDRSVRGHLEGGGRRGARRVSHDVTRGSCGRSSRRCRRTTSFRDAEGVHSHATTLGKDRGDVRGGRDVEQDVQGDPPVTYHREGAQLTYVAVKEGAPEEEAKSRRSARPDHRTPHATHPPPRRRPPDASGGSSRTGRPTKASRLPQERLAAGPCSRHVGAGPGLAQVGRPRRGLCRAPNVGSGGPCGRRVASDGTAPMQRASGPELGRSRETHTASTHIMAPTGTDMACDLPALLQARDAGITLSPALELRRPPAAASALRCREPGRAPHSRNPGQPTPLASAARTPLAVAESWLQPAREQIAELMSSAPAAPDRPTRAVVLLLRRQPAGGRCGWRACRAPSTAPCSGP